MRILNTLALSAIAATAFTTAALAQTSVTVQTSPMMAPPAIGTTTTTTTDQNGNIISQSSAPSVVYPGTSSTQSTVTQSYTQPMWNYQAHDDRNVPDSDYTGN